MALDPAKTGSRELSEVPSARRRKSSRDSKCLENRKHPLQLPPTRVPQGRSRREPGAGKQSAQVGACLGEGVSDWFFVVKHKAGG